MGLLHPLWDISHNYSTRRGFSAAHAMGLESDQRSVRYSQNNGVAIALGDTSGFPHNFFILYLS